jgi:hypothetical protein
MATPQETGFQLEELIHNAISEIPNSICMRERDIQNHLKDTTLNGIDHWIQCNGLHIFIQDKWKERTNQHETTQFTDCVRRIMTFKNIAPNSAHRLWVTKTEPGKNMIGTLKGSDVRIIQVDTSINALSRQCVFEICEIIGIEATPCLSKILLIKRSERKENAKFLYERDISGFDSRKIVKTKGLIDQQLFSLSPIHEFWRNLIMNDELRWGQYYIKSVIYALFKDKCKLSYVPSETSFWIQLNKIYNFKTIRVSEDNQRYYKILVPLRNDSILIFNTFFGNSLIEKDEEDEEKEEKQEEDEEKQDEEKQDEEKQEEKNPTVLFQYHKDMMRLRKVRKKYRI